MTKKIGPKKLLVSSSRNSRSGSIRDITQLNFNDWWTDGDNFMSEDLYLHVPHKDDETVHRVHCKKKGCKRLMMKKGKLYWLIDK